MDAEDHMHLDVLHLYNGTVLVRLIYILPVVIFPPAKGAGASAASTRGRFILDPSYLKQGNWRLFNTRMPSTATNPIQSDSPPKKGEPQESPAPVFPSVLATNPAPLATSVN